MSDNPPDPRSELLTLIDIPESATITLIGEGNLHAVVSLTDTGNAELDKELLSGKIIRICKSPVTERAAMVRSKHYSLVSRAIGGEYLSDENPPKTLAVGREAIKKIDGGIGKDRLEKRVAKCPTIEGACFSAPQDNLCHAQIMSDIATSDASEDVLTLELKPKCGIRAIPGYPCRFVMQRSDDPGFSLEAFYDPHELYFGGDVLGQVEKLFDQKPRGFLKLRSPPGRSLSELPRAAVCLAISLVLQTTPILSRLASLQHYASIDEKLPDFAAQLWEWLSEQHRLNPNISIEHRYPEVLPTVEEFRTFTDIHDVDKVIEWLSIFLLGRMAMDVSIFLSFSTSPNGSRYHKLEGIDAKDIFPKASSSSSGTPLWYRLTVIDIDPKPFSKLPFYFGQLSKCKTKFISNLPTYHRTLIA